MHLILQLHNFLLSFTKMNTLRTFGMKKCFRLALPQYITTFSSGIICGHQDVIP
jgi:hypothetical protein